MILFILQISRMLLKKELNQIEAYLKELDRLDTTISSKSIAWHLDHSLKVIITICNLIEKSDSTHYHWKFNFIRTFVLLTGYIPRGKGKAPKEVLPPAKITQEDILKQITLTKNKLNSATNLAPKNNFKHPYFGQLNLKQTLQFLKIHTKHHLKICSDIIA